MGQQTIPSFVRGRDAVVWTREYSHNRADRCDCGMLERTLRTAGAERMVVGHTIQQVGINGACDGRVLRCARTHTTREFSLTPLSLLDGASDAATAFVQGGRGHVKGVRQWQPTGARDHRRQVPLSHLGEWPARAHQRGRRAAAAAAAVRAGGRTRRCKGAPECASVECVRRVRCKHVCA